MNLEWEATRAGHDTLTEDGFKKHIYKSGSREHVLSFTTMGEKCSVRDCVINHRPPSYDESIYLN